MKVLFKVVLAGILLFIIAVVSGMFYLSSGLEAGGRVQVNPIYLESLKDGNYIGKYKAGRWTNELRITVQDQRIIKIDIVKDVKFPKPEWTAELLERIIKKQNTDIDIIAGATVTSKAYLKSVENALQQGNNK